MATTSDSCGNCQRNSVAGSDQNEKDLQSIFRKLRVNNKPKKVTTLQHRIKCTKTKFNSSNKLPGRLRKRKILRDATFVFARTDTKTYMMAGGSEHKNIEVKRAEQFEKEDPKATCSKLTEMPPIAGAMFPVGGTSSAASRIQGCGEQFRNQANIRVTDPLNMDDTTPGELAAYFDQLLHIPKPMSQMAEMMYT